MAEDPRQPEPRTIDATDPERLREIAAQLKVRPELVAEAVERVGPNLTAVELYLAAPRA